MKRKSVIAFLLLVAIAPGAQAKKLTKEQKEWHVARDKQPLTFVVSAEESDAAWERARQWIANFSMLPIQTSDATIIQTQSVPDLADARTQFSVTRAKGQDGSFTFRVKAINGNIFARGQMEREAHALAYSVASGIPYPE